MTTVRLLGLPVPLFRAFEEHSDALLREYVLLAVTADRPYGIADVARARRARGSIGDRLGSPWPGRIEEGPEAVDVEIELDEPERGTEFAVLQGLLDDAVALAHAGQLLTLPSLPEIVALRNWVCEQVIGQIAGAPARRWTPRTDDTGEQARVASWPGLAALPADEAWIVGDDHNRIIHASAAALRLLGWEDGELVGQRIVAVIPPHLRERHVARFTLAVLTGEHHLLGQRLPVSAWTRDGHEVPVTLSLARHASGGRTVYVASLTQP